MKINFEDQEWDFDLSKMDLRQARHLKANLGLTVISIRDGLKEFDPDALLGIYWLMKAQNGKVTDLNKVNFNVVEFFQALVAGGKEAEENPTQLTPSDESATPSPKVTK